MAVEGEWAWPRCIGCGKKIEKKRPRDGRYGMDVCCSVCLNHVSMRMETSGIGWKVRNAMWMLAHYQKREAHDDPVPERDWLKLAAEFSLAWARLRDHFQMPPFPAGLELFMVEIHNDRSMHALARG